MQDKDQLFQLLESRRLFTPVIAAAQSFVKLYGIGELRAPDLHDVLLRRKKFALRVDQLATLPHHATSGGANTQAVGYGVRRREHGSDRLRLCR
ncbi:MAG: hypothetical protein ACREV2_12115 [Burkholderiales bacterium]